MLQMFQCKIEVEEIMVKIVVITIMGMRVRKERRPIQTMAAISLIQREGHLDTNNLTVYPYHQNTSKPINLVIHSVVY